MTPRLLLALASLLLLAPPAAAGERDLSGRWALRGLRGLRPVEATLTLRRTSARTYDVVREERAGGAATSLVGEAWQEGSALSVRFDGPRAGLVHHLPGASRGGAAPRWSARYRFAGRLVAGEVHGPAGRVWEAGRRTGPAPALPAPSAPPPASARPPARLEGRLRVVGRELVDPFGRAVLLRGVNAGSKAAPFLPPHGAGDPAALAASSGANLVRLYVAWRAIEPAPLRYDAAYLDAVVAAVDRWAAAGFYVLLDLHQDAWGGAITKHGAPEWATLSRGRALRLPASAPWQLRYLDPRVYGAFEALWADQRVPATGLGLQEHYARAAAALAARLRDRERVVGYDLLNEPFYGREVRGAVARLAVRAAPLALGSSLRASWRSLFGGGGDLGDELVRDLVERAREPGRFLRLADAMGGAGRAFEARLAAFYGRVGRAIRAVDPDRPLFVEPVALAGVGVPSALPHPGLSGIVYAPHLYDAFVDSGQPYDGRPERLAATLERHREVALRLGAPLVVGEWGHVQPGAADPLRYVRDAAALLDGPAVGAAYWEHRPGMDPTLLREVLRPYPRRVAGRLEALRYDPAARRLEVRWQAAAGVAEPTVLAAPAGVYPHGVRIALSGAAAEAAHDPALGVVLVWARAAGSIAVRLEPATTPGPR